jgi:hypothetical protein
LNSKNTVLYFALGEFYVKQAVLSLVSLLSVYGKGRPGFDIIVLTDMPERFDWLKARLPLDARLLTREHLPELSGPHGFVLRAKIAVMAQIHSETKGNLLFIDTDTILRGRLEKIFRIIGTGECFLHKREWPLSKGRKLHPELCPQDLEFKLESGTEINIDDCTQMWNSGVVGIPESGGKLLHDALNLCDRFYEIFPGWHVEQFSLSIILYKTGRLRGCRRKIFHYWHSKELAASFIQKAVPYANSNTISNLEVKKFVWEARFRFYIHRLRVVTRKNVFFYRIYSLIKHR